MNERVLFLGLGKVNRALSQVLPFPQTALEEIQEESLSQGGEGIGEVKRIRVWKRESTFQDWKVSEERSGEFDSLDFSEFLPAQVFISPGIDPRRTFFEQVRAFETSELDYFCEQFKGKVIAITGTDGKSTFTTQLGQAVKWLKPESKVFVGGNLGNAMAEGLLEPYDWAVLEVSSFQAERLKTAEIECGIFLNFAIDHQDRYSSLKDYFEAKAKLLKHSRTVFFPDAMSIHEESFLLSEEIRAKRADPFAYDNRASLDLILEGVAGYFEKSWKSRLPADWKSKLPTLPHRLEVFVDEERDLWIVNDSKATTVHAALYGYLQMQKQRERVIWLIGGRDKGDDFSQIPSHLRPSDEVILFGEAKERIQKSVPTARRCPSLDEAVSEIAAQLKRGDTLLLSPACSSYDEFNNFEERGQFFLKKCGEILPNLKKR